MVRAGDRLLVAWRTGPRPHRIGANLRHPTLTHGRPPRGSTQLVRTARRGAARPPPGRSAAVAAGDDDGRTRGAAVRGAAGARPGLPGPLLSGRGVVHAGRPRLDGDPVLPGASAAREARAVADARRGRRRARVVHAHPPARGRPRGGQRLQAAPPAAAARAVRALVGGVSRVLHAETVQQELRDAPRSLVRAEPSRRGLRRDVRGLADAAVQLGTAVCGLAGAEEAGIHGQR